MNKDRFCKVLFRQLNDDNEIINESVWATNIGDKFRIENIPFYIRGISFNDIVQVESINGELLATEILEESGQVEICGGKSAALICE